MSRTPADVAASLQKGFEDLDPTIEVGYGPVADIITPVSSEVSSAETEAAHLSQLYSTEFLQTATDAEVAAFLTNYTLPLGSGAYSTGTAIFVTYTRLNPGETLMVPVGTLVGNGDNSLIYSVTAAVTMYGDSISSYYNATSGWYELAVPITATTVGKSSDLPSLRLKNLLTPIPGISIVLNRSPIRGGQEPEDNAARLARVQNAFTGQDNSSYDGVVKIVENYDTANILGVAVVRSTERDLFLRFSSQLAMDVYINGQTSLSVTETYTITASTNFITFLQQPVISVDSVIKNGVATTATLVKDTGIYQGSPRGEDILVFSTLLLANDVVTLTYSYNNLLHNITKDVFSTEGNLFDIDTLVRGILQRQVVIQATLVTGSSANADAVLTSAQNMFYTLIETNVNGAVYQPGIIRQQLVSSIPGLSNVLWFKFTTTVGSQDVETIQLPKNAIAKISSLSLKV